MESYRPYFLSFARLLRNASWNMAKGGCGSITVDLLMQGVWEKYDQTGFDKRKRFNALKAMLRQYIYDHPETFIIIENVTFSDSNEKVFAEMKSYTFSVDELEILRYAEHKFGNAEP